MTNGHYYMSRVIKLGQLKNAHALTDALLKPAAVIAGKFAWTITDVLDGRQTSDKTTPPFIFGKLSKFNTKGQVTVVDVRARRLVDSPEPNLLIASSPFVYLPHCSGLAYLHVWNQINDQLFPSRLKTVVEAKFEKFFVECEIEPVSDYTTFLFKLRQFQLITEITAKVHPPNPLFGRRWASLNSYIKSRGAGEVMIREKAEEGKGLQSKITQLVAKVTETSSMSELVAAATESSSQDETTPADIGDAALLMAADGYGHGKIEGITKTGMTVVRTSDTQKSFLFAKEPEPRALAQHASEEFDRVTHHRDMRHP